LLLLLLNSVDRARLSAPSKPACSRHGYFPKALNGVGPQIYDEINRHSTTVTKAHFKRATMHS